MLVPLICAENNVEHIKEVYGCSNAGWKDLIHVREQMEEHWME